MLAKPFEEKIFLQNPKHYLAEYKWDGIRAQIIISPSFKIFLEIAMILQILFLI